ncbi:MAG: tRNA1(Val) (adenine(37)-N6)-methyltransferase, partial [Flavobacteriales bacterium]
AVCFGAWCELQSNSQVLDIGSGTGLLSLMLAQRFPDVLIEGIELDPKAAKRCRENYKNSPFSNRLSLIQGDVREAAVKNFDAVVCNPPFFHEGSRSYNLQRDLARNSESLSFEVLAELVHKKFNAQEVFFILPIDRESEMKDLMISEGYCPIRTTQIIAKANKEAHRSMLHFSKTSGELIQDEILMRSADNSYTASYNEMCRGFYLRR